MKPVRQASALALLLLLSACGGGADTQSPVVDPGPTAAALNEGNYVQAASTSMGTLGYTQRAGSLAGLGGRGPAVMASRLAGDSLRRALALRSPSAQFSLDLPCPEGGKIALQSQDANGNGQMDAGDSIALDAQSCRVDGVTLQGRIGLALIQSSGVYGIGAYSAVLDMSLQAFTVTAANGDRAVGNGTLRSSQSVAVGGDISAALDSNSLTLSGQKGAQAFTHSVSNLHQQTLDEVRRSPERRTESFGADFATTALGGHTLRADTPQPFVTLGLDLFPSSGQLLLRGGSGSQVRVTALNNRQALVELDANGDGQFEIAVTKNWIDLV